MFDFITEPLSDAADFVGDTLSDAADFVEETAEDVGDWVGEAAEDAADWAGEAVIDAAEWTGDALVDVGDGLLTAAEESGFFDAVDTFSVGLVDLEYDDDGFSMNIGIKGVIGYGVDISEDGVGFRADALLASANVSVGADGFGIGGSMGLDFGPFPYVEGHASVDPDGNFGIGGEVHLYIPTPAGMVGAEVVGDYQQTNDGYRVSGSITGGYYAPTGTYAKAGVHASYEEDADGYHTNVGVHAEVGQAGVGSVRVSADYDEGRHGDVRYSGVSASVEGDAFGASAGVQGSYQHIETPDGEYDVVSGKAYAEVDGEGIAVDASYTDGPDGESFDAGVHVSGERLDDLERSAESLGDAAAPLINDPFDAGSNDSAPSTGGANVPSLDDPGRYRVEDTVDVLGSSVAMEPARDELRTDSRSEAVGDRLAAQAVVPFAEPAPPEVETVDSGPLTAEAATEDLSESFGSVIDDAIDEPQL